MSSTSPLRGQGCDLSRCAARDKVRVAHALKALPEISAAFSKGELSYSKVRALTRISTPVNEASLLDFATSTTAARVEERCQQLRNVLPGAVETANRAHERRLVWVWRDTSRATLTLSVELPVEMGELVCQALDKAVEADVQTGPEFEGESWSAQQADALVAVARHYLSGESDGCASTADAYQVVVHVDGVALHGDEGRADLALESVKRLSCDGSVVPMVDGANGEPLNVGRKQRTPLRGQVCRLRSNVRCGHGIADAPSPDAVIPALWMRTTSGTGPKGARRAWRIRRYCAARITAWFMKAATRFVRTIWGDGISDDPTDEPFRRLVISRMTGSTSIYRIGGTRM